MADYCRQCAKEIFGPESGVSLRDLAGLSSREETLKGLFAVALCEGCGTTLVDHNGKCVSSTCLIKHEKENEE